MVLHHLLELGTHHAGAVGLPCTEANLVNEEREVVLAQSQVLLMYFGLFVVFCVCWFVLGLSFFSVAATLAMGAESGEVAIGFAFLGAVEQGM